jgi:hypothetical protein
MSARQWNSVSFNASVGMLRGEFGFITTNIGTNPSVSTMFGVGGLKGPDAAGSVSNSGPSFVESIVKTANAGEYLITYADGYRKQHYAAAQVYGPAAGPADGVRAQVCVPNNEGAGHSVKVTQLVTTLDAAGAPVETTGRRVCVKVAFKDSASGA